MQGIGYHAGKKQLIVRAENDNTVMEIWHGNGVAKEIHIPKALHGKVYADSWFGLGAAWSPQEDRIAYVAEVQQCSKPITANCLPRTCVQSAMCSPLLMWRLN